MNSMPPKDSLPPDIRDALMRAVPEENRVYGVTEAGEVYWLAAIPVPGPGDRVATGGVRLGLKDHLGLKLED